MRSAVKSLILGVATGATLVGSTRGRAAKAEQDAGFAASPELPSGAEADMHPAGSPAGATAIRPACSYRFPVCVHPTSPAEASATMAWLSELEMAYRRLVDVLRLPPPLAADDAPLGSAVNLHFGELPGVHVLSGAHDPFPGRDAASSSCVVDRARAANPRDATLCVGEAIALALDASETPFSRRALATELWWSVGIPTSEDAARIDDFQAHPERAVLARDASSSAEGSALFFEIVNQARGRLLPPDPAVSAFALSAQGASFPAFRLTNEPDLADVVRATFGPKPSDVAAFYGRFALARATLGSRDADAACPELAWLGDFGRPRFEWNVRYSSLPRRLAPARAVEPTGATYVWLDLDRDPGDQRLVFHADWEPPVAFAWELAILSDTGHILRRVSVPFLERNTSVDQTVVDLRGARGVLIAGTNLGGLGPSHPFDPDYAPYEPHAYEVTLRAE